MKFLYNLFIYLFVLSSCSFDKSSHFWQYPEKTIIALNKSLLINENEEYNDFKNKILKYSEKEDYPDISN